MLVPYPFRLLAGRRRCLAHVFGFAVAIAVTAQTAWTGPLTSDQSETQQLLQVRTTVSGAQRELELALTHFREGRPDDCLAALQAGRKLAPTLPPAELMFARLLVKSGNAPEALRRLDRLAMTESAEPEVFVTLGELALQQGRLTDAWLQFEHAASTPPPTKWDAQRLTAFRNELSQRQGETAERREDWTAAEQIYRDWSGREPKSAPALLGLGRALLAQNQIEPAVELFRQARQIDPQTPAAESVVALIFARRNDERAEVWFGKAIASDIVDVPIRLEFAHWLIERDRAAEAETQLAAMPGDSAADPRRQFLRGLAARCRGDLDAAQNLFATLQRDNPADWAAANQLALVLIERTDEALRVRAAQLAEVNLKQSPDRATALATAGWVQLRLGDLAAAEKLLQQSLTAATPAPATRYYVSRLLAAQGRTAEAEKWRLEALEQPGLWVERTRVREQAATPVGANESQDPARDQ